MNETTLKVQDMRDKKSAGGKSRRARFLRVKEYSPRPLSFDDDDRPPGRAGDLRPAHEVLAEFPPSRVREAGLTGASMPGGEVTADDLAPETLLDDNPSHSPSAHSERDAMDTVLHDVSEADIGAGGGLDEAEEAWADPISPNEQARRQRDANRLQRKGLRAK